jgi:hypothetical protein
MQDPTATGNRPRRIFRPFQAGFQATLAKQQAAAAH